MDAINIVAWVCEIRGNRAGDRSEKVSVSASYESANILSTITFEVSVEDARSFYVGQQIQIQISRQ